MWLLMKIVTWWGDFGQVGTCGVRSNPDLGHGEEISVVVKNKFCNGRVFVVYGSDVCVSDMQTIVRSTGDKIPPCFTPLPTLTHSDS